ncbi:nucleotidyltransferase domain-containing protein [Ornithinibacillus sp. JPR2-1]|uniref:nucleotidyltransferase family protein n=1 Tax=Ornithinibacillus sp. JPR2-1 TaxID=2094019 RepID=UPI0031D5E385
MENYGINRIGLFGSYSCYEQKESSDIDVIVEFDDADLSSDNYMDLKITLGELFQKPIDLVILNDIKPALMSNVLSTITFVTLENQ